MPRASDPVTLGDVIRAHCWIATWCDTCQTFGADLDPKVLAEQYGDDALLSAIAAKLKCGRG